MDLVEQLHSNRLVKYILCAMFIYVMCAKGGMILECLSWVYTSSNNTYSIVNLSQYLCCAGGLV